MGLPGERNKISEFAELFNSSRIEATSSAHNCAEFENMSSARILCY